MTMRRRAAVVVASIALLGVLSTGATLWLHGYRMYVVHTGSMAPTYPPGTLVVDGPARAHYRVGEVITFRHSDAVRDVVTHRVVGVTATGGIQTKGDANRSADAWTIRPDQVQGRALLQLRGFGYLAVYLRQSSGIASVAVAALALTLLWGMFFPSEESANDGDTTALAIC